MMYSPPPWNLIAKSGHGSGGPRWVICAPDYEHRIAVISLNGAANGDQNIALDNANLLNTASDLLKVCEQVLQDIEFGELGLKELEMKIRTAVAKGKGVPMTAVPSLVEWEPIFYPVGKDVPVYHGFNWGGDHRGVDYIVIPGTPVAVVRKGKVIELANDSRTYGRYVMVLHNDGFATLYAHLMKLLVKENEVVEGGQIIALSDGAKGSDGAGASKGHHLHFEVRPPGHHNNNWNNIDPVEYLKSCEAEGETE